MVETMSNFVWLLKLTELETIRATIKGYYKTLLGQDLIISKTCYLYKGYEVESWIFASILSFDNWYWTDSIL